MTSRALAIAVAVAILVVPISSGAPNAAPSLKLTPRTIEFGKETVTLSGVVPGKRAGQTVSILSQACLFTQPAEIGTVKSKAGGVFTYRLQPLLNTTFRVKANGSTGAGVKVSVRPVVALRRPAAGRYLIQVSTTNPVFLDGKPALLQRAVGAKWVTVKRAILARASPETAITVLSSATVKVKASGTLRALVPAARGCYVAGTSPPIPA